MSLKKIRAVLLAGLVHASWASGNVSANRLDLSLHHGHFGEVVGIAGGPHRFPGPAARSPLCSYFQSCCSPSKYTPCYHLYWLNIATRYSYSRLQFFQVLVCKSRLTPGGRPCGVPGRSPASPESKRDLAPKSGDL